MSERAAGPIALTFSLKNYGYSAHAITCTQARTHSSVVLMPITFASTADARSWADAEESEKAARPFKAPFKVCQCVASTMNLGKPAAASPDGGNDHG